MGTIESLDFKDSPFAVFAAEREPNVSAYLVKPPYYETTYQRAKECHSYILFGGRGSGKSATRITILTNLWNAISNTARGPLPVVVDDYRRILVKKVVGVTADAIVEEIAFLAVQSLLVWLSNMTEDDRLLQVETLPDEAREEFLFLIKRHYIVHTEGVRRYSNSQLIEAISRGNVDRVTNWSSINWSKVSNAFQSIFSRVKKAGPVELHPGTQPSDFSSSVETHPRATLERVVRVAQGFGFSGVSAFFDKADETEETANSHGEAARLLHPLLAVTNLLEVSGFGALFFLWDRMKEHYSAVGDYPVRLDKIGNAEIKWTKPDLKALLDKRIKFFSDNKRESLRTLFTADVTDDELDVLFELAMKSPRALINVMDKVVQFHVETSDAPAISKETLRIACDAYAVETLKSTFPDQELRQVLRMSTIRFTNADVQSVFKVGLPKARSRVQKWEKAGIVQKTGDRPALGGGPGAPAAEYSIVDGRVKWIIEQRVVVDDLVDVESEAE